MQRIPVTERPNLADAAAEHELEYVAGEGVTGWDESAYYQFTMVEIAEDFKRTLHPISTGYSSQGPDLGAAALQLIKAPKIAVLKSEEANTLSYGEIWHYHPSLFLHLR